MLHVCSVTLMHRPTAADCPDRKQTFFFAARDTLSAESASSERRSWSRGNSWPRPPGRWPEAGAATRSRSWPASSARWGPSCGSVGRSRLRQPDKKKIYFCSFPFPCGRETFLQRWDHFPEDYLQNGQNTRKIRQHRVENQHFLEKKHLLLCSGHNWLWVRIPIKTRNI